MRYKNRVEMFQAAGVCLNASGSSLVYSTYLGSSGGGDQGHAIAIDDAGDRLHPTSGTKGRRLPPTIAPAGQRQRQRQRHRDRGSTQPARGAISRPTSSGNAQLPAPASPWTADGMRLHPPGLTHHRPTRPAAASLDRRGRADRFNQPVALCAPHFTPGQVTWLRDGQALPTDTLLAWNAEPLAAG